MLFPCLDMYLASAYSPAILQRWVSWWPDRMNFTALLQWENNMPENTTFWNKQTDNPTDSDSIDETSCHKIIRRRFQKHLRQHSMPNVSEPQISPLRLNSQKRYAKHFTTKCQHLVKKYWRGTAVFPVPSHLRVHSHTTEPTHQNANSRKCDLPMSLAIFETFCTIVKFTWCNVELYSCRDLDTVDIIV